MGPRLKIAGSSPGHRAPLLPLLWGVGQTPRMGEVPVLDRAPGQGGIAHRTLRLLIVEDSEQDAQLIEWEIRHGGFDVAMTRVEGAVDMRIALLTQPFDIIISDHT